MAAGRRVPGGKRTAGRARVGFCASPNSRKIGSVASFASAKARAFRRGLAWELDREEFRLLQQEPCWYCGGPLPTSSAGLDRFNEFEGYRLDNVAPCCWYCNTRRHNRTPIFFRNLFVAYRARYGEFRWPGPISPGTQRWYRQSLPGGPPTAEHRLLALGRELEEPGDRLPWPELPWPRPPENASERLDYNTLVVRTWQAWLRACRHE